jgi:hypothetical protein
VLIAPPGDYTRRVSFACPACDAGIDARPDRPALRCPSCGALLRSRPVDADGPAPVFEVEALGRGGAHRRVEVPWDESQRRRLAAWLLWSSVVTLGLVLVLYLLARQRG